MKQLIIICGATASGKSKIALELAQRSGGVIINADSMQVYRQLPILTAQPVDEEHSSCSHYLYGHVDCGHHYSVAIWVDQARSIIDGHRTPILVGGTGMYINTLINGLSPIPQISPKIRQHCQEQLEQKGLNALHQLLLQCDPRMASRISPGDTQRILRGLEVFYQTHIPFSDWQGRRDKIALPYEVKVIWVNRPRKELYQNCDARFIQMLERGALDEVSSLMKTCQDSWPKVIGLDTIRKHLMDQLSLSEAVSISQQLTRNYAKRQVTWFKNQLPKLGVDVQEMN